VGAWDGFPETEISIMLDLTTLPLAGGQRGDEASSWPEGRDGTPSFVETGPEDAADDSELDALFDVELVNYSLSKPMLYYVSSIVCISILSQKPTNSISHGFDFDKTRVE
jgi:hypothetical protein